MTQWQKASDHLVSLFLGYREVNAFYRAFKDWDECTPQEYRHNGSTG
ncbi:MAG: hypothetical protein K9L82_07170 [Chromatiaceae bacterium]|nr:hypothetical protein [Chromatiaceae bacterium]MCF7993500.1 hypothetical protein [Chromatiaceae bacterium]